MTKLTKKEHLLCYPLPFVHQPLTPDLMDSIQALAKEQAEVASNISNEGIKVIKPILKLNCNITTIQADPSDNVQDILVTQ